MRTIGILAVSLAAATSPAQAPASDSTDPLAPYSVDYRGPNERTWSRPVGTTTNRFGQVVVKTERYVELEPGACYLSPDTDRWEDASPEFTITAEGGALASHCQHRLAVSSSLADPQGLIDCQMPDGTHWRSAPLGVFLYNPATGQTLQISTLGENASAEQTAPNEITFFNALDGMLKANLRIRNEKSGFHQDVLLNERFSDTQLQKLAAMGLTGPSVRMEVWSEVLDAPVPAVTAAPLSADSTLGLNTPVAPSGVGDESVVFPSMALLQGRSFLDGFPSRWIPVFKQWNQDGDRRWLIEASTLGDLLPLMSDLPTSTMTVINSSPRKDRLMAARSLPPRSKLLSKHAPQVVKLAKAKRPSAGPQVVLDYQMGTTTVTNFVFQSDTTYFINGNVTLCGTNIWEGNSVLKFASNASLTVMTTGLTPKADFRGGLWRPVVFTAKDDDRQGAVISGSTGTPTNRYANPALNFSAGPLQGIGNIRFSYAQTAISLATGLTISNAQFIDCNCGVSFPGGGGGGADLRNALFTNVRTNFDLFNLNSSVAAQNVTFAQSKYLVSGSSSVATASFTNCILANITNLTTGVIQPSGSYNGFYASASFGSPAISSPDYPFQTAGCGSFYLLSPDFRNAGTTNIAPGLLAALKQRTTWPPLVYSNLTMSGDMALQPQAQRGTTWPPSLGWHYDPIDYAFGMVYWTNGLVTAAPGTVIGAFGRNYYDWGLGVGCGAQFRPQGAPNSPVWLVRHDTVQELSATNWTSFKGTTLSVTITYAPPMGKADCRFTAFSQLADSGTAFYCSAPNGPIPIVCSSFRDCEFHGGTVATDYPTFYITNCLLDRVYASIWPGDENLTVIRNCLFYGGTFDFAPQFPNVVVKDNLFHLTSIPGDLTGFGYDGGYNGFIVGSDRMLPTNSTDVLLPAPVSFQSGPLGNFYLLTNSPLINAGSTTADAVGLYHYTVTTNLVGGLQIKETNSIVDISYHYVATDAQGNPSDVDGDGICDALEDLNGNGLVDGNETSWTNYNSLNGLTGGRGLQVFTPLKN